MKRRANGLAANERTMSKQWKQVKILETFEEADVIRQQMLTEDESGKLEVRVRRCGPDGSQFKIKTYLPQPPSKTQKKGKKE